jgi:predicted nucleic acid-binding protein
LIRYLIDTNVISEMRKPKPHGGVSAWMRGLEPGQAFFSAVTFGEIQKGVEITRQQDPVKATEIEAWARQLQSVSPVLPMDAASFQEYARLMHRRSATFAEDAMIAATARLHGLTVVTRSERDFRSLGVAVFNPFKA